MTIFLDGQGGFAGDTWQAAEGAGEGVDLVHAALDDERHHSHRSVVEGETLSTQYNIGMLRKNLVDGWRRFAVAYEYGDSSFSILHQVLGFWIRHWVNAAKIQNKIDMQTFFMFFLPFQIFFVFLQFEIIV